MSYTQSLLKNQTFLSKLTNIKAQKINNTMLNTYKIVVILFSMTDQANQIKFFETTFLVANVSSETVFEMFFLILSNVDVNFLGRKLR